MNAVLAAGLLLAIPSLGLLVGFTTHMGLGDQLVDNVGAAAVLSTLVAALLLITGGVIALL